MDSKTLNALDGSSILTEVMGEKIEAQRKSYKKAIKNAAIRNDEAQEAVAKSNTRAEKTKAKLDALVEGGMEGFLSGVTNEEDDDSLISAKPYRRPYSSTDLTSTW